MSATSTFWTPLELAYVDGFVRAGIPATRCLQLFPDRTPDAVSAQFRSRRRALGIPPMCGGRPARDMDDLIPENVPTERTRKKPAFVIADPKLVPEPKVCTKYTPEADGCNAMLRRMLKTGAHWITNPDQFRSACKSVGL